MNENKAEFCKSLCDTLRLTSAAGDERGNPLVELRYMQLENGTEIVRPIFADGTGRNGFYDVNVTCDSNMGILHDVFKHFIKWVW